MELQSVINELSTSLRKMVEGGWARLEKSKDINDFVTSRGAENLHGLLSVYPVQLYAECFKSLGMKSRTELETLWGKNFHHEEVRDAVEELLLAEDNYRSTSLVQELDRRMHAHEEEAVALPVVVAGECLRTEATFVEARSGDTISLKTLLQKSPYTLFVLRKHYV